MKKPPASLGPDFKMAAYPAFLDRSLVTSKRSGPHVAPAGGAMEEKSFDKIQGARKILLVDDNADLLEMTKGLFEERGFEVWTATSGAEAVKTLQQVPEIDVLFTDIVMPGMSGFQLGRKARGLLPGIKIILVSGYPNPATQAGGGDIHDFDFLSKPYRMDDVLRLLAKPN